MTEESTKGKLTLSGKSTLTLKMNKAPAATGRRVVQVEVRKKRIIDTTKVQTPKVEIDEETAQKLKLIAEAKEHDAKRKEEEEKKNALRRKQDEEKAKNEALKQEAEAAEKKQKEKEEAQRKAEEEAKKQAEENEKKLASAQSPITENTKTKNPKTTKMKMTTKKKTMPIKIKRFLPDLRNAL